MLPSQGSAISPSPTRSSSTHSLPVSSTRLSSLKVFLNIGQVSFGSRAIPDGLDETKVLIRIQEEKEVGDEVGSDFVHY